MAGPSGIVVRTLLSSTSHIMVATFNLPYVPNLTSWGPPTSSSSSSTDNAVTEKKEENGASVVALNEMASRFASLPYAPFSRSDRLGRCADFTSQSFARTGDATAGYYLRGNNQGGRRGGDGGKDGGGPNKNLEFQYKVDTDELREFQLVDSSKAYGASGMVGAGGLGGDVKRFIPQARRRANATRLRQINQRRNDDKQGQVGRYNQPQRTRAGGR